MLWFAFVLLFYFLFMTLQISSVILPGGFQGVSLQANWVRVLWIRHSNTHTRTRIGIHTHTHTHTHTPDEHTLVLAVLSVGTDTELVFVSQHSPLMCGSILHAAVPFLFLPSLQTQTQSQFRETSNLSNVFSACCAARLHLDGAASY